MAKSLYIFGKLLKVNEIHPNICGLVNMLKTLWGLTEPCWFPQVPETLVPILIHETMQDKIHKNIPTNQ